MTRITIVVNADREVTGFEAVGHADKNPGNDIVCSAISVVFEMLTRGSYGLPEKAIDFERNPSRAHWRLISAPEQIPAQLWSEYNRLLFTASEVFREMGKKYSEHCTVVERKIENYE